MRARALAALLLAALPLPARAAPGPAGPAEIAAICDAVAGIAAAERGVPLEVMRAITRTETGRRLEGATRPWPWTINIEGAGFWFETEAELVAAAGKALAEGRRSFDMGCFQINYLWHGTNFASLEAMADPLTNARYAAKYLSDLYAEKGDWTRAAGRYHSATPEFADRYTARFTRFLDSLPPMPGDVALPPGPWLVAAPADPASPAAPAAPLVALPATPGAVRIALRVAEGGLLTRAKPLFN